MKNIKLKSSDNKIIIVDVEIAKYSELIKEKLKNCDYGEDNEIEPIPLHKIDSTTLEKVLEWASHHKDDPPPTEGDRNNEKRTDDISAWDIEYLNVDQPILLKLVSAANYLDMKGLLDVTCKTVANMIKGKSSKEIHKTFSIENNIIAAANE